MILSSSSNFEGEPPVGVESAEGSLTIDQAIANLKQGDDPGLRYYAAWWLGRFRVREPEAVDALLEALQDTTDRAPDGGFPLRRNAARALGKLGDRRAVPDLILCLDCEDYYVRESAAQALEQLGDPSCVPALLQLLAGGVAAAQSVPGKPHLVQPYDAVIEALGTLRSEDAISEVAPFLEHPVGRVQYAAARAMYQLTGQSLYGDRLIQALQGPDLQLRRVALMDLGAIGYLPAATAIAETLAENSLKLIALKGVLECHLGSNELGRSPVTTSVKTIMALMDSLL